MRADHVEQVLSVIRSMYREIPQEVRLRKSLLALRLKSGAEKKVRDEPRTRWIHEAREFARSYIAQHGSVNVHIIREHLPLPPTVDERATGGVLKHPDFVKVDDKVIKMSNGRTKTIGVYQLDGDEDDDDDYGFVEF